MAILRVKNPVPNARENPQTYLTLAAQISDTSLNVASASGFTANRYLQIGDTGVEQTELKLASIVSGTPFTVAALTYAHPSSTPIYEMRYNQVRFYRMRSNVETLIATVDIQPGSFYSVYNDPDTLGGDTYASSLYNSTTGDETAKTDYLAVAGYAHNSYLGLIRRAQILYDDLDESSVKSSHWGDWLNEGYSDLKKAVEMKDQAYGLKMVENTSPTDLDDQSGTSFDLASDFGSMKSIWVKYGTDYQEALPEGIDDATPLSIYNSLFPAWSFDNDSIIVRPYQAQAVKYRYYPILTRLVKDGDILSNPISQYDDAVLDYMLLRAAQRKVDKLMIPVYTQSYQTKKSTMQREITQRNKGRRPGVQVSSEWASTRDSGDYI